MPGAVRHQLGVNTSPPIVRLFGDFRIANDMIQGGKRRVVCHGPGYCGADGLHEREASAARAAEEECGAAVPAVGNRRPCLTGPRGGGSEDPAGWIARPCGTA